MIAAIGTTPEGAPIYERSFGTGFSIVVEGRRGGTNAAIEASTFLWVPGNPNLLPGLQVLASRPLGNGSTDVCDDQAPFIGGVPAQPDLLFDGSQAVADSVNDLACRFKDGSGQRRGRDPDSSCTLSPDGIFRTVDATSNIQFCGLVNSAIEFPSGDTTLNVRIRDVAGNVSATSAFVVRVSEN